MSRPNNSIGKIKLPGENVERPLVPYALGYSSNNNYQATIQNITEDAELISRYFYTRNANNVQVWLTWKSTGSGINMKTYYYGFFGDSIASYQGNSPVPNLSNNTELNKQWFFPTNSGTIALVEETSPIIDIVDLTVE